MNETDLINLKHDVDRHEEAVIEDANAIVSLKADLKELLKLVQLLDASTQKLAFGTEQEKTFKDFRGRLQAMLQKHGLE
jgi:hypothetical protein